MKTFWDVLAIDPTSLVAGFAGGLVKALLTTKPNPWTVVSSVVIGALTANYLSPFAAAKLGTSGGATPFLMGLGAMWITQALIGFFQKWQPLGNGNDSKPA
jgi:hypothetical protein